MTRFGNKTERAFEPAMFIQDIKKMFTACQNAIAGAGVALAGHEAKIKKSDLTPSLVSKWISRLNSAALLLIFTYVLSVVVALWTAWATEKHIWEVMSPDERKEIKMRIQNRVIDAGFSKIQGVQYAESTPQMDDTKSDKKKGGSK